ncbi:MULTISPECIES: hypothetical protein [Spirosoma]|uniref:Uncharacterized protein n=1 Tax=Spirosoma liriopis TaxID=2937440 RepID=A0ABT0HGK3_9BACT|nr:MULTISPECIES: hypothetical protein [Spirosoma]MCK8491286.1 hypothetical protein [Spirosoma liriopis]UHG90660.1 hypothetical protein LQ777_20730 [Spirosoma oryzicola]
MSFFAFFERRLRVSSRSVFFLFCFFLSLITLAQVTLKYRMLNGYFLSNDAPVNKGKPTLFVFDKADAFEKVFKPATTMSKRPDMPNFNREVVIGISIPATNKPPKLSISRVFVQDSVMTVRYIRMTDTTLTKNPLSYTVQPMLLLAVPAQKVLKTRLIENGKVILTLKKQEDEE